ncbi:hypothetical protein [Burkholderia anthina]|uniref:hypothetical protein n=1 Tax=Burkholderia anthina TaxID=179879 RepID=UPI00158A2ED8|nr:hypothetical protein [Burkholderia anthina]
MKQIHDVCDLLLTPDGITSQAALHQIAKITYRHAALKMVPTEPQRTIADARFKNGTTSVATVRVTHGGYGMELSTYVTYALPEGVHKLYAAPQSVLARLSQVEIDGYTPELDKKDDVDQLVCAAVCYASADVTNHPTGEPPDMWPWQAEWWKPTDERQNIEKAITLLIKALNRLTSEPRAEHSND